MRKNHRLHFHRERYSVHPVNERKNPVQIFKRIFEFENGFGRTLYNAANRTQWFRAIRDNTWIKVYFDRAGTVNHRV